MKRSVLFLTNAFPDFSSSYRGIFIQKMASLLQTEGYRISVVTPKIYDGSPYLENQNGIKVYRFPFFAGNKLLIEYKKVPYLKMVLYYLTGLFLTSYVLFKNRCSLIHAHWAIPTGLIGALVGGVLRKPLVVTIHGSDLRMAMESSGLIRKLFIFVSKRAAHVNCVSKAQEEENQQLGIPRGKMSTFPMGVEETFLEAGRNRERISGKKPFTILSNRNLLPIYNVSLLIRAIPMVLKEEPATKFLIAGEGAEKESLEEEARNLRVSSSVQFLGRVPHQQMPHLLSRADLYVSTSLSDGTSVSLLEAMAVGSFPVITDILANREWVTDGENGFLVSTENEDALARRIIDAMHNQTLLERAREKNCEIVREKAFLRKTIQRMAEIYEHSLHCR